MGNGRVDGDHEIEGRSQGGGFREVLAVGAGIDHGEDIQQVTQLPRGGAHLEGKPGDSGKVRQR